MMKNAKNFKCSRVTATNATTLTHTERAEPLAIIRKVTKSHHPSTSVSTGQIKGITICITFIVTEVCRFIQ